ncbi:MAG: competence/damage-inducible protein A [Dehalococcoidales bacterium]|nr:competence/damage-inducible protein A [Dehalococcoidales bacterium]
MKAEIVSVGTEILLGEITDTNASFLAGQLPPLGIDLYWVSQVGDNQARIVEVLKRAWGRSDIILITGGLGPTEDDLTREAIAEMVGEEMRVDPALLSKIEERFARRGIKMSPSNVKQATVIPSATAIPNPRGTAPGWWVEKDGHIIIAMPGPPAEMLNMWHTETLPRLQQRTGGAIIFSRTIKLFGLGESVVGEMVSSLFSSSNPTLGIYAKSDGIHLRFTAKARDQKAAEVMLAQSEVKAREILGEYIWGVDDDTLDSVVGRLLVGKGVSLAVMESTTGGMLTATITEALQSVKYFKGGLVANSAEALTAYGVDTNLISDYGVVSAEVAQAMAEAARRQLRADVAIGITGVVGPDEVESKTVGTTYIGLDNGQEKKTIRGVYPAGDRSRLKRWTTNAALFELRKMLLELT